MKTLTIWILVGLLVLGSIFGSIKLNSARNEALEWQNRVAHLANHEVVVAGTDTAYVSMAEQLKKIKTENDAVKKELKATHSKLRYYTKVAGSYAAELDSSKDYITTDTIYVVQGDSISVRRFAEDLGLISVAGNFDVKEPYSIRFTKAELDSFSFSLSLAEGSDGVWRGIISDQSPGLHLQPIITQVAPYRTPWYSKLHLDAEVKSDGGGIGVGFGNWTGMYYTDETIGVSYSWYLFRRK